MTEPEAVEAVRRCTQIRAIETETDDRFVLVAGRGSLGVLELRALVECEDFISVAACRENVLEFAFRKI